MSRIPFPYTGAPRLSADARAALASARLVWDSLSGAQRRALRDEWDAKGKSQRHHHQRTLEVLRDSGLVEIGGDDWPPLTALGLLVREAGLKVRVEVDDAA